MLKLTTNADISVKQFNSLFGTGLFFIILFLILSLSFLIRFGLAKLIKPLNRHYYLKIFVSSFLSCLIVVSPVLVILFTDFFIFGSFISLEDTILEVFKLYLVLIAFIGMSQLVIERIIQTSGRKRFLYICLGLLLILLIWPKQSWGEKVRNGPDNISTQCSCLGITSNIGVGGSNARCYGVEYLCYNKLPMYTCAPERVGQVSIDFKTTPYFSEATARELLNELPIKVSLTEVISAESGSFSFRPNDPDFVSKALKQVYLPEFTRYYVNGNKTYKAGYGMEQFAGIPEIDRVIFFPVSGNIEGSVSFDKKIPPGVALDLIRKVFPKADLGGRINNYHVNNYFKAVVKTETGRQEELVNLLKGKEWVYKSEYIKTTPCNAIFY